MSLALLSAGLAFLAARIIAIALVNPLFKLLSRSYGSVAITAVFGLFGSLALVPVVGWMVWRNPAVLDGLPAAIPWSFLSSISFTGGLIAFMWALRRGDINLLVPLTSLSFIFLYLYELAVHITQFAWGALGGILLVMVGLSMLNLSPGVSVAKALNPLAVIRRPGAPGALLYGFCLAACRVFDSTGVQLAEPLPYALVGDAMVTTLAFLVLAIRGKLPESSQIIREQPLLGIGASLLGITGYVLLLICFEYFRPSQIEPTSQISVMLAVLIGTVWFREPLHLRIPASLLICGGAVLVIIS
ncbi:EamA family transporter [bacterium]|nr:EamA family transporter [bacterium]